MDGDSIVTEFLNENNPSKKIKANEESDNQIIINSDDDLSISNCNVSPTP